MNKLKEIKDWIAYQIANIYMTELDRINSLERIIDVKITRIDNKFRLDGTGDKINNPELVIKDCPEFDIDKDFISQVRNFYITLFLLNIGNKTKDSHSGAKIISGKGQQIAKRIKTGN